MATPLLTKAIRNDNLTSKSIGALELGDSHGGAVAATLHEPTEHNRWQRAAYEAVYSNKASGATKTTRRTIVKRPINTASSGMPSLGRDRIRREEPLENVSNLDAQLLEVLSSSPSGSGDVALPSSDHAAFTAPSSPFSDHDFDVVLAQESTDYVATILEIVPDVLPDYAEELIHKFLPDHHADVIQQVVSTLLEDPTYPKLEPNKKRRRGESVSKDEGSHKRVKMDYASLDRPLPGGQNYANLALEQLVEDFPEIPKPYIRKILANCKSLYAPTYLFLKAEKESGEKLPYTKKRRPAPKGKGKAAVDPDFALEREWLLEKLSEDTVKRDAAVAEALNEQEYEQFGEGIDCGCCFTSYPFDKMIQCPETHLFCTSCMQQYAETLLGSHDTNIICMDQSGCKLPFPVSELRRVLSPKLMALYERVKQGKEIAAAELDGLEECPFCDYKCVIENPEEKLFRCGNEDSCGAITCRQCKKADHLPKSCKEVEEDRGLDARHKIEEAMTRALMRNCPKCQKAFIKELGCNKMSCPNCGTLSCYVCRKVISDYSHFSQGPPTIDSKKCPLWEEVESRHSKEVKAAYTDALEKYQQEHPDIPVDQLQVELPREAPNSAPNPAYQGFVLAPIAPIAVPPPRPVPVAPYRVRPARPLPKRRRGRRY